MRNRLISGLIALLMLLAAIPTAHAAGFTDTGGHWAEDDIARAVSLGLFSGVSETEFAPDSTMTRGMFVTVLGRLEQIDTEDWSGETAPQFFTDVSSEQYYAPYITWAVCNGIVSGMSREEFLPEAPITREQMARLVALYARRMGYELADANDTSSIPDTFSDGDAIAEWALESIEFLRTSGILNGAPDKLGGVQFLPQKTATRAECAAVFCRLATALRKPFLPPVQPERLTLNQTTADLTVGQTLTLLAETEPESGIYLLWRSSNEAIVTVESGTVTAKASGTATVTVYSGNGLSASCVVTCREPGLASDQESYDEKCYRIFGVVTDDPRTFYTDRAAAEADMVQVTVNVWDFNSGGEKVTKQMTVVVHKALEATIRAIFREIYEGEERFPIHYLGGWGWSGRSEHTIGCALDINYEENYYCTPDGTPITGKYWKPGEDPYSIPLDGEVATIFKKYGFSQGVNWRSGYKDYMHFSYFGT